MAVQVRATQLGYHAHRRRREGEVFDVEEHEVSKTWMERIAEPEAPAVVATAETGDDTTKKKSKK